MSTRTDLERRLRDAEDRLSRLLIKVAEVNVLVGVLMASRHRPEGTSKEEAIGIEVVAESAALVLESGVHLDRRHLYLAHSEDVIAQPAPKRRRRPRLRAVPTGDSVSGQDMDEALRRVREGDGR
ncbi:hypothetical protein [Streptomyces sp. CAI-85]|uniref:hypothetical protein n=1 Tax=Streptomyces sp. CAI-85 TaxID=1472662 RepID=UPI0015874D5A|nr:hypothetical protein [Streptomyces sp. CAI-85]NUV63239.1 hypothetical protein [Streptomyces sp. CAI-85]